MRPRPAARAALVASALLAPAGLAAQVPADSARAVAPVVVTGTRAPAVVGGAAAVVVVPDSLRLPPAPMLEQALRELPFVLVRQNARGEMEVTTRGSESRQTAIVLDGLPLTLGWDSRVDPSLVPLTGARRIVLVRGLSSLLHGPNVLGGVVDVGIARPGQGARAREVALATGVDQYGARALSARGAATHATAAGAALTVQAGAAHRARDGFALGRDVSDLRADDLRLNSDVRNDDAFVSLGAATAAGAHAGITATGFRAERGVPPELHLAAPRLWRYPSLSRTLAVANAGTGERATRLGRASLDASAGYTRGLTAIEAFTTADYDEIDAREWGDERTATARVVAALAPTGGLTLRAAVTGAEVRYRERLDDAPASRYRQRLWSLATEGEVRLPGLSALAAGVALDGASTPETGGREALAPLRAWGGRLGVSTLALGAARLHASLSRRSRFPALRELYSGALDRFQPNPALAPETLTGAEAGATVERGAARMQAVLFHHRLRDAVVRTTLPDRRFFRVNRDEIRGTGVELLGGWSRDALLLDVDAAFQSVRVFDQTASFAERHAEHQPEVRAGADARAPLPLSLLALGSVRYAGRQYCTHPDLGRQVALGGRGRADLGMERTFGLARARAALLRSLRVALWVDNVGDAAIYDQCGLPQAGRTLRVSVDVR